MKNDYNPWTTIKENLTPILAICGVVATLGNLWIISSVAPLSQQIIEVKAQQVALEKTIDLRAENRDKELEEVRNRLDRIDTKLDLLIQGGK